MRGNTYLDELFNLKDKIIFVTGACGQLGKVICQGFLDAGSIVIGADVKIDENNVIQEDNISYYSLDIVNKQSIIDLFNELEPFRNSPTKQLPSIPSSVNILNTPCSTSPKNLPKSESSPISGKSRFITSIRTSITFSVLMFRVTMVHM